MKLPVFLSFFSLRKLAIFGFGVFLLVRGVQAVLVYKAGLEEVAHLQDEVGVLAAKVEEERVELAYRQSPDFVYKVALEQLNWARPGEIIVFLPDIEEKRKEEEASAPAKDASASVLATEPDPYWKRWRNLFFGN